MNKKNNWVVLILWTAMLFVGMQWMKSHQKPTVKLSPAKEIQQVVDQEKKAGRNQKELYKVAKNYENVGKKYKNTKAGQEARLHAGEIYEKKIRETKKSDPLAINTYKSIIKDYPPEKYEIGKEAQERKTALEIKTDKRNQSSIMYKTLDWFVNATGKKPAYSYALALLIITVIFKLLTAPLSSLQFKSMKEMQRIQPMIKELQEKYKSDQKVMSEKVMQLYKDEGVNPFTSCIPILIQMPILMLLYNMVRQYQYQFSFGKFLWIGSSLADKFPSIIAQNLAHADIPLLLLYTISMFISQRMTPVDPTQADQQKIMGYTMPIMFGVMMYFWAMPSAFMLYWLSFNIVSTLHQHHVLKRPNGMATAGAAAGATSGGSKVIEQEVIAPKRPATSPGKANRRKKR